MKIKDNIRETETMEKQIVITGPEKIVEIQKHPWMIYIFLKAVFISLFRSKSVKDDAILSKSHFILKNYHLNSEIIHGYKKVCNFSLEDKMQVPISYLQSLFIGLFGKYITSSYFPISPLGLIHTYQSFEQKRPIKSDETIDLACSLKSLSKTEKGLESTFRLEVFSKDELIWEGVSVFLTKTKKKKKTHTQKKEDDFLEKKETIPVPRGTGMQYARVSGDYNPHHLSSIAAKFFGFKGAIAHGMWSLARVIASLDRIFVLNKKCKIEGFFKLPVFMPAETALGYEANTGESGEETILFELRDNQKGLPHLKGRLLM